MPQESVTQSKESVRLDRQRRLLMGTVVSTLHEPRKILPPPIPNKAAKTIKVGVVIPTRGDRPQFLEHAKYLLQNQSRQPDGIYIIDYPPKDGQMDLVERYRAGFEQAFAEGMDLVLAWEDDDWYHPDYIKTLVDQWEANSRPVLIGLKGTIYYHIGKRRYKQLLHPARATMACSAMTKDAISVDWNCPNQFLDLFLWKRLPGKVVDPGRLIYLGIKHGQGLCGGMGHKVTNMYHNDDKDLKFLSGLVDGKSLEFYGNYGAVEHKPASVITPPIPEQCVKPQGNASDFGLTDIIIPTYGNEDYTIACIRSIQRFTKPGTYRIIWVDNGSKDRNRVMTVLDGVNHIKVLLEKNEGFVGAVNQGLMRSDAPTVCLLNNDTLVSDRWLDKLLRTLYGNSRLGILGPLTGPPAVLEQYDSHHNIAYQQRARQVPVFPKFVSLEQFNRQVERQIPGLVGDVDFVAFLCAVIKREVIDKVGLLDANYAMGMWDDCDYNRAAKAAGYDVKLLLDTCIYHKGRTTFNLLVQSEGLDVNGLLKKNRKYLDKKWGTRKQYLK